MNRMSTSSVTPHRAYGSIPQPNLLWPRVLPFYSSVSGPWEHGGAKTKEVARLTAILGSQIPRREGIQSKTKLKNQIPIPNGAYYPGIGSTIPRSIPSHLNDNCWAPRTYRVVTSLNQRSFISYVISTWASISRCSWGFEFEQAVFSWRFGWYCCWGFEFENTDGGNEVAWEVPEIHGVLLSYGPVHFLISLLPTGLSGLREVQLGR